MGRTPARAVNHDILPFPRDREVVVDAGRLASRRHIIHALIEVDVSRARERMRSHAAGGGGKLSFTAFIVASLSRAIESMPEVQALRDWRGRLVVFRDVDVVVMIEPEPGAVAIPHIIRRADSRSLGEISGEIRSVQGRPERSEQRGGLGALAPRIPRLARHLFYWTLRRAPRRFKRVAGTAVVTSVGMFGKGGGWGLGFLPMHTLGLTVGGIVQRLVPHDGGIVAREHLNLTVSFDHDVVDGAPAARFTRALCELIESAAVLEGLDERAPS